MRKVYLQCEICGQKMKVSRSAIGKKGACPRCGLSIRITTDNTSPFPPSRWERPLGGQAGSGNFRAQRSDHMGLPGPSEEAKQRFAMGVDLFCDGRYEEALSVFNALARLYPGNPDIESAREQCLKAMQRKPITLPPPEEPSRATASEPTRPRDLNEVQAAMLDTLMEKMQQGKTEAIQLQAVELLLQLLPRMEKASAKAEQMQSARNQDDTAQSTGSEEKTQNRADAADRREAQHSSNGAQSTRRRKTSRKNKSRGEKHQKQDHPESESISPAQDVQDYDAEVIHPYAEVLDTVKPHDAQAKKRA